MSDPTLPQGKPVPSGPIAPNPALVELEKKQDAEVAAMNERHAKEIADLTAANANASAVTAAKAKQDAEAKALTAKHEQEIAAVPDANPSPDNIALPQVTAGPIVLNGVAAVGGVATLTHRRRVVITSAGDDRGINWTVTGTRKPNGPVVTDTFAGANAGDVRSSFDFLTVTKVSGSGPSADMVSVGVAALPPQWVPLDEGMVLAVAQSMAQAHHGADVEDVGGYMDAARTFVAGAMAVHAYGPPKEKPAPAPSPAPAQGTLTPPPAAPKPTVGAGGSGVMSAQQPVPAV